MSLEFKQLEPEKIEATPTENTQEISNIFTKKTTKINLINDNIGVEVLKKLQQCRLFFKENSKDLKSSGKNAYANFNYLELQDFIDLVSSCEKNFNVTFIWRKVNDVMQCGFYDLESGQCITYYCDLTGSPLRSKMNEMQWIGSTITYSRRYIFMQIFEIVEKDSIDSLKQEKNVPIPPPAQPTNLNI